MSLDKHLKICFLIIPRECGGLPVLPMSGLLFRGHPDYLVLQLRWIKWISQEFIQAKRLLDLIVSGWFVSTRIDLLQLIQDPYSVNFTRPVQTSNIVKNLLRENLNMTTRNVILRTMLESCNSETLKDLVDYLGKTRPFNPRVLNEILRLSPDGSMLSFLSTFTDMRTMKQILIPKDATSILKDLSRGDLDIVARILEVSKLVSSDHAQTRLKDVIRSMPVTDWLEEKEKCTRDLAQELRQVSWALDITGVTTPHPCEQTTLVKAEGGLCSHPSCKGGEAVIYVLQKKGWNSGIPGEQFKRGSSRHYLGSGTSEKRSGAVISYPKSERALRAAQQLLRVKAWVVEQEDQNNTLPDLLSEMILARCDASEEYLILTSGVNYGGSVQHRFSDVTSKHESRPGIRVNVH